MKCLACNKTLTNKEATRRYVSNGEFVDLCNNCMSDTEISFLETNVQEDDGTDFDTDE